MRTICEARVLDIWDLHLTEHTGLLPHFERLVASNTVPSLDDLISHGDKLVSRYMSTNAYRTALSASRVERAPPLYRFPTGCAWESESTSEPIPPSIPRTSASDAIDGDVPQPPRPTSAPETGQASEAEFKVHVEEKGFTGDRVLANSILFCRDFLLWLELSYAVADGDIGRVVEILKLWIFAFAGASKPNYTTILLEMYCLFRYESSKKFKDAIWNNWLVNITGELGKWIEDGLLQEHYNKWLEDMVAKHGGTFDDPFFRSTISPNVDFFLRLKEELETAFELCSRGKTHTSSSLSDVIHILMRIYREDQLHYFRTGRSMGFAALDLINIGFLTLSNGKLAAFLSSSTKHAKLLALFRRIRTLAPTETEDPTAAMNEIISALDMELDVDEEMYETECRRTEPSEPAGEADWQFHLDEESGQWESFDDNTGDVDEEWENDNDPDIEVDEWAGENDNI
ncbi:hypothetical protein BDZ89DRAFT_1141827 [Hymenopellis radicata]|nr:hypothetical protein BDZ89DRAFT_1141827 [Hymenopellis radicata]